MRKHIDRILCATDFSDISKNIVPYSIQMAKEFSATLYICHVIDLPTISLYGEAIIDPISQQQQFMDVARREIEVMMEDAGVSWEPLITVGHITEEIARLAVDHKIDLVVSATHGRSGLKRLFLGSVTERLMRTLACPLLVLRAPDESGAGSPIIQRFPFKRILVGCDFSVDSEAALDCSLNMAQEFESELHLLHVVEPTAYQDFSTLPGEPGDPLQQDLYDSIKTKLHTLIPTEALNWCSEKTSVMAGKPYAELVRYAELNDIDLIALGVRGHGMVEELLVGSTTDRVIRRAPCPVLSVNPSPKTE